jgi:redox-sensitive bicupin YhaK (pirin superfamily)
MTNLVDLTILPRSHDIGGFEVKRALPFKDRRMVGPFIFWDQIGPGEFVTGQGLDVRPHPHIGLSTVTYLFDGTLDHKDSLGNNIRITTGDINLMTAGKGIVHSERTGLDIRQSPSKLFGIQSWLAQPKNYENGEPNFEHTSKEKLPVFYDKGIGGTVILGQFEGIISPVQTQWETLYIDLHMNAEEKFNLPPIVEEQALYLAAGTIEMNGIIYDQNQMLILAPGEDITIKACRTTHLMILGGAPMDSPRYIWWNFVSSSRDQIEQAKEDWKNKRFPSVPSDENEFIPLP